MVRLNKVNDLSPQEWLKFTKSWFVHHPRARGEKEKLHPAKFPEDLVSEFIQFFTKEGATVLDPFLGTGSTLVACDETNRIGIGIELQEKYAAIARKRTKQKVIVGDARDVDTLVTEKVDFVITSPPYGPMLKKKGLIQKARTEEELDVKYSEDDADLGNIDDYGTFVGEIGSIFRKIKEKVREGGYVVVILQNYREGKEYRTLAWDVANVLKHDFTFAGVRLWLQDNKTLYPYGMGYSYVPNIHHHYCLIFKR